MKLGISLKPIGLPVASRGILSRFSVYLLPLISVAVALVLLVAVVWPRVGAIFRMRAKLTESKQKVTNLETKLKTLRSFNYDQLLADVKKVEIVLPSDKNLPSLLSNLESLASQAGVQIAAVQLTPGELVPSGNNIEAGSFPVKITITGNFFQIKTIMGRIPSAARVMSVKSLTVGSGAQPTASLSATFNLDSYFQSLDATKFTVDEPLKPLLSEEQELLKRITPVSPVFEQPAPVPITGKADPFAPF